MFNAVTLVWGSLRLVPIIIYKEWTESSLANVKRSQDTSLITLQRHRSCDVNQTSSSILSVNCNSFLDHPSNQEVNPRSQTALQNVSYLHPATSHLFLTKTIVVAVHCGCLHHKPCLHSVSPHQTSWKLLWLEKLEVRPGKLVSHQCSPPPRPAASTVDKPTFNGCSAVDLPSVC